MPSGWPHEPARDEAIRIRDDVAFFQAVRAVLAKNHAGEKKTDEDLDYAIRQIVSKAIVSDEVVDIFAAAGLKKPDISMLSDDFLTEVRGMPQRLNPLDIQRLRCIIAEATPHNPMLRALLVDV